MLELSWAKLMLSLKFLLKLDLKMELNYWPNGSVGGVWLDLNKINAKPNSS